MLSSLVIHLLPVLQLLQASESSGEKGGVYLVPYFIGAATLLLFVAMVIAVLSIGRGRGNF